jgi:hypothetical protein
MAKRGPKAVPLSDIFFWEGLWYSIFFHLKDPSAPSDAKIAMKADIRNQLLRELEEIKSLVPKDDVEGLLVSIDRRQIERDLKRKPNDSEPAVWRALISARTATEVRQACSESKQWLNPEWHGRPYVKDLHEHAEAFVRAKKSPYYPRQDSSDQKRAMFFARAMAGIALGLSPETAIDRLRKYQHGPKCPCVHCDLKRWNRIDVQIYEDTLASESGHEIFRKMKKQRPMRRT